VNSRKLSRLRKLQSRRKRQRLIDRFFGLVIKDNKQAMNDHIADSMIYGVSQLCIDSDLIFHQSRPVIDKLQHDHRK